VQSGKASELIESAFDADDKNPGYLASLARGTERLEYGRRTMAAVTAHVGN
jgi:hypothetical protein